MKITICGSMNFAKEMLKTKSELEKMGHRAIVPQSVHDCLKNPELNMDLNYCREKNVQEEYFKSVAEGDAILVLNYERKGTKGYIGGATLMEIGLAQHLNKKIFLLYPPPKIEDLRYSVEIQLAKPIVLDGNLDLIK